MDADKKYELTLETKDVYDTPVYRIRALKRLKNGINPGDLGGFVSDYHNLSQNGECWVADEAVVTDQAVVLENAWVGGTSEVYDQATIRGDARVIENATVKGDSLIDMRAVLMGNADVSYSVVTRDSRVCKNAFVSSSKVSGNCMIHGESACLDSNLNGVIELVGEAFVEKSTIRGERIMIKDKADVRNATIGKSKAKNKDILIANEVRLNEVQIFGTNISIKGQVKLGNGVSINGENVSFTDDVFVSGNVKFGNDVHISEFVYIENEMEEPLQFNNEKITGDANILR